MITQDVWSPVRDDNFSKNLNDSPVWKNCYHEEEVTHEVKATSPKWYVYSVKFEGVKPIMVTKVKHLN
jgi:hypothetical protein